MIVDSMTPEEILHELKRDAAALNQKEKMQLKSDHKNKVLQSFQSFPIIYTREITTMRKNRYIVLFHLEGKMSQIGKYQITDLSAMDMCVHYREGKGYYGYVRLPQYKNHMVEYIPHFFKRYAERMGVTGNPVDVMKTFFKHNRKGLTSIGIFRGKRHLASAMEEGISFGVLEGCVSREITFLSYESLFANQKPWLDSMKVIIKARELVQQDSLSPKEHRKARREILENMKKDEQLYEDFWYIFARTHLKIMNPEVISTRFGYIMEDKDQLQKQENEGNNEA